MQILNYFMFLGFADGSKFFWIVFFYPNLFYCDLYTRHIHCYNGSIGQPFLLITFQ